MKLKIRNVNTVIKKERNRFDSYLGSFMKSKSPYLKEIEKIINLVKEKEEEIFVKSKDLFVLNHGDYHPKNIIIGQDKMQDISTLFISVIDFANAILFLRAFDVGCFLSQLASQFNSFSNTLEKYTEAYFIDSYIEESNGIEDDFIEQVKLFKIRTSLSIASYFIKVGKGESPEMEDIVARMKNSIGTIT